MAFCRKCGAELQDGARFCSACGTKVYTADEFNSSKTENIFSPLGSETDSTCEFDALDISQNKLPAVLAYIGLLILVPIFGAKNSKFARFHANQGLVLLIASVAYSIIRMTVSRIFLSISYHLAFVGYILSLATLGFLALEIIGIVNAAQGRAKELPLIGKIRILK